MDDDQISIQLPRDDAPAFVYVLDYLIRQQQPGTAYGALLRNVQTAGSGATSSTTPLPIAGPWTAGQQGDFVGGCEADALTPGLKGNAPDAYCICALRYAMGIDPDPSVLGAGVGLMSAEANLGNVAAEHPGAVPGCGKLR